MIKFFKIFILIALVSPLNVLATHPETVEDWLPMDELNFCEFIHVSIDLEKRSINISRDMQKDTFGEMYHSYNEQITRSFEKLSNLITSYSYFCK